MKRITILAATTALLALPALGTTAAFAATDDNPASHVGVHHAKHGADDPVGHHRHAGHHRHHGLDDKAGAHKHGADDPAGHHSHHRNDG